MLPKNFLTTLSISVLVIISLFIWLRQREAAAQTPLVIGDVMVPPLPPLDADSVSRGELLYQQFCAACHMPDLSGAPNWKERLPDGSFPAPPHDDSGHTWHHPDFLLIQIIEEGGAIYDGTMPGFRTQLTQKEMLAILDFLKSRWSQPSREYQWWLTNTYPTPTPSP